MREASRTTRQRMADRLREDALTASELAREFEVQATTALNHVRHVAQSLDGTGEQLLVAPPECRACGFDDFDDPANRPSRCPECKSEDLAEPTFRVD
ncbi:transcriptional regulator [Halobacteriales archaeon Cl-PHB]